MWPHCYDILLCFRTRSNKIRRLVGCDAITVTMIWRMGRDEMADDASNQMTKILRQNVRLIHWKMRRRLITAADFFARTYEWRESMNTRHSKWRIQQRRNVFLFFFPIFFSYSFSLCSHLISFHFDSKFETANVDTDVSVIDTNRSNGERFSGSFRLTLCVRFAFPNLATREHVECALHTANYTCWKSEIRSKRSWQNMNGFNLGICRICKTRFHK